LDKINIQIVAREIAIAAFITDVKIESRSPYPEIEKGPKIVTVIAPPKSIKSHITNKNPKIPIKATLSSKMQ